MESTAKVIRWNKGQAKERPSAPMSLPAPSTPIAEAPPLGCGEDSLILLSDEQLDALGTIFCMSPLRKSMTFEAYLVVRGFARPAE